METRHKRFIAAIDYLKREKGIKSKKELAQMMGLSETSMSRISKGYTAITDDVITKLQTATDCVFNLQWLHGEEDEPMLAADIKPKAQEPEPVSSLALMNLIITEKDKRIKQLEDTIEAQARANDEVVTQLKERVKTLEQMVKVLREHSTYKISDRQYLSEQL